MLVNHVSPSVGFMSTSDKRLHFGLADEATVKSVKIVWPSGAVQELTDLAVDRVHVLEEPK
jgi:hypothetical protein